LLTTALTPIVVIAGWEVIQEKVAQYMAAFLVMEGLMIGVFSAVDAVLFYVFWEGMLIPMFIIIGIWGGPNRIYATIKFFLYTLLGSLLMLVAFLYLYHQSGSFSILEYHTLPLDINTQILLFIAFFAAFAVKVPMFPVHTWLPDAHVEAPTGGSVILAAILLKMGAYGFLRFTLPILPDASHALAGFMITLSLIAVVYIALVALVQEDMKKLIAYSSIAHMGFVTLGDPDDLPRLHFRRPVPVRRRALRPRPFAADLELRWRGQHHAGVRILHDAVRHGQFRAAGHVRFRGRVPGDTGGLPGQRLVCGPGGDHADIRCRLHPVDVQARDLR
jgi:hypothetical protein